MGICFLYVWQVVGRIKDENGTGRVGMGHKENGRLGFLRLFGGCSIEMKRSKYHRVREREKRKGERKKAALDETGLFVFFSNDLAML